MEFIHKATKDKYIIADGMIKTINKKGFLCQVIFIKDINWIWSTATDDSAFNLIKRLEIHMASKDDPIPIYVENSTQAKEVLEEIYKYK